MSDTRFFQQEIQKLLDNIPPIGERKSWQTSFDTLCQAFSHHVVEMETSFHLDSFYTEWLCHPHKSLLILPKEKRRLEILALKNKCFLVVTLGSLTTTIPPEGIKCGIDDVEWGLFDNHGNAFDLEVILSPLVKEIDGAKIRKVACLVSQNVMIVSGVKI